MTPKGDRRQGNWFVRLLRDRTVQAGVVVWVAFSVAIPFLSRGAVPFNRPSLAGLSYRAQVLAEILGPVIAFVFIVVAWALTQRRTIPDISARAPERSLALRETAGLILYGAVVLIAGQFVGKMVGTHGIGLHLPGSMFGLSDTVTPREAYVWSVYNFVFYAAIPYFVFRIRGYSREALCLKSSNLRNDTLVILVMLAMTCLGGLPRGLTPGQLSVAGGLALALSLVGTGLPIVIFLCAVLVPRYRRLTGSTAGAVVLGGFTYAGLHLADSWTRYDTLAHGALSVIFIVLLYGGPGLVKAYLTLRTGNAWVHLWGYHVIAPHVTTDTPIFVHIFRIR